MTPTNPSALFGPRVGRGRRAMPTPLREAFAGAIAILAGSALTLPNMALASEAARVVVRHGDLDLGSLQGVALLEGRVTAAARRVCLGPASGRYLVSNARRCIAETVDDAARQVAVKFNGRPATPPARSR